jgi:hypothetical protein
MSACIRVKEKRMGRLKVFNYWNQLTKFVFWIKPEKKLGSTQYQHWNGRRPSFAHPGCCIKIGVAGRFAVNRRNVRPCLDPHDRGMAPQKPADDIRAAYCTDSSNYGLALLYKIRQPV